MELFDSLSSITSFSNLFKAWRYLTSSNYRREYHEYYKEKPTTYMVGDIGLSFIWFALLLVVVIIGVIELLY